MKKRRSQVKLTGTRSTRDMQMVYQDPESSLDPRMKIGQSIGEPLHGLMKWDKKVVNDAVTRSLERVGLSADFADVYPTAERRAKAASCNSQSNCDSTLTSNLRRTYECTGRLRSSADSQATARHSEGVQPHVHSDYS